jgi:hypothetical protein
MKISNFGDRYEAQRHDIDELGLTNKAHAANQG